MEAFVRASLRSGCGRVRKNNEDAYYMNGVFAALENMDQETALTGCYAAERALFAVCDGVGGAMNGERASHAAVSSLRVCHAALREVPFAEAAARWADLANQAIYEDSGRGACTAALVYVGGGYVQTAHLGDSRVYRLHDNQLTRLTRDHSGVQALIDAGILTAEEAKTHPDRHMIVRYLGAPDGEQYNFQPELAVPTPAVSGDRYLICSDGVTDMVEDAQIKTSLMESITVEDAASTLYEAALSAGGRDNTTLIVLELVFDDEPEDDEDTFREDQLDRTERPDEQDEETIRI